MVKVAGVRHVTGDLFQVWITRPPAGFGFKAGQYCTVGMRGIERAYSIVSAPSEAEIELLVELVPPPDGQLTPLLHRVKVGDEVSIRPRAKGLFVFSPTERNQVMVCTVTGIAPFISMLRDMSGGAQLSEYNIHLLVGVSYQDELAYHEESVQFAKKYVNIDYVPTVSRPAEARNGGWTGLTGRVNEISERYLSEQKMEPGETVLYACGHPLMIEAMRGQSAQFGFKFAEERFWKEE